MFTVTYPTAILAAMFGIVSILTSCSLIPQPPLPLLGSTSDIQGQLAEACKLNFAETKLDNGLLYYAARDNRDIYVVTLLGSADTLMRTTFTVTPTDEPVMWRDNYVDRCLVRFLAQIGQAQLHDWYYEHRNRGKVTVESQDVRVILTGGGTTHLVLEITGLPFADLLGATTPPDTPHAIHCGVRVVAGLSGQRLNVRAQPGATGAIIAKLTEGMRVRHLCHTEKRENRIWAQIEVLVDDTTLVGWVSEGYLLQP